MKPSTELPRLLSDREAAKYLNQSPNTLAVWRSTGRYDLPYTKIGRKVLYREADLAAFVERKTRGSR